MSSEVVTATAPTIASSANGWRQITADSLLVGSGTLFGHALGAITSLLLRDMLGPAQMGIWQGLKSCLSYGNYTNLGISKAATQELCLARGRGDEQLAQHPLNLAHSVNTLSSLLYAVVLAVAGLWIGYSKAGPWADAWCYGLIAIGGLAMLQRLVTFQVTILRARQAFSQTTRLTILEAVLTLAVSAIAVWCWGLYGLYLATAVVLLASLSYVRQFGPAKLRWTWDRREIGRLVGIGAPILLSGVASSVFRTLDRWMILGYLDDGEYQLGCYSLALMVGSQLYGLANMLNTVMQPRYGELLGRTQSARSVAQLAAQASQYQAACLALPAGLAILAGPGLFSRLLSEYQAGLPPLVLAIPGVLAVSLALPASQYLVVIGKSGRLVGALLAATLLACVGNHLALCHGFGLNGVAVSTSLANVAYLVLVAAISIWPALNGRERRAYAGSLTLAIGGTAVLAGSLQLGNFSLWIP